MDREAWHAAVRVGHDWATELDGTEPRGIAASASVLFGREGCGELTDPSPLVQAHA